MASPQLELFHIATDPPEQAHVRWERLLAAIPLNDFDADAQRLLPAVWLNLLRAGQPFSEGARLRGSYRLAWVRNQQLRRACAEVLLALDEVKVEALVLKGVAFNSEIYRDQGARPSTDFDLLVPFQKADLALQTLAGHGWLSREPWIQPAERLENAVALRKGDLELDLHWFLLREARTPGGDDPFWRSAVSFELEGRTRSMLCPTHQLFHLLVLANREPHNRGRYLLDLANLMRRHGADVEQKVVAGMLEQRHLLSRLKGLPLAELGLADVRTGATPSLLDRAWTEATRYVFDGSHEWHYVVFPFLDYWLHYRRHPLPGWGFTGYLLRRLRVRGWRDFLMRTWHKAKRMVGWRKR